MGASRNDTIDAITPAQLRAARALLGWSQDQLAAASDVPKRTIARFELSDLAPVRPRRRTMTDLRTALEVAGVEFIPENGGGPGVRLKKTPRA